MLKTLHHKDELVNQSKKGASSDNKVEKLTKKEYLEVDKPIDPKYIFNDYKKPKGEKGKTFRKPRAETDGIKRKPKIITLNDW